MTNYIFFFVATVLAFFVKGITGFGNTLVMSPLFSFFTTNKLITPVDLLLGLPANAYMAFRERRHISLKIVLPLTLMLIAGIIPAVFILKGGSDKVLKAMLGLAVVAIGVEMGLRKPVGAGEGARKTSPALLTAIGVISGFLCGLFGIGAPLVAYISRTTDSMGAFRANLCFVFLMENLFRLAIYSFSGIMTGEVLWLSLILLPAAALGLIIGMKVNLGLKPDIVKKAVITLMAISGTALFIANIV